MSGEQGAVQGQSSGASTTSAGQQRAGQPAPAPKVSTQQPKGTQTSKPVGSRPGDNVGGQQEESAVDRALARKAASDSATKENKKIQKGKVKSLADIKKLHSSNVSDSELKTGDIEVDNEALPTPKLEPGRPEPKVKTKTRTLPEKDPNQVFEEPTIEEPAVEVPQLDATTEPVEEVTVEGEPQELPTEEEFTPNYKYKFLQEEFDIPEIFRSAITDAASEKQVRDVLEKSHAVDRYKARDIEREQYLQSQVYPALQNYRAVEQDLMGIVQSGDIFSLAEKFGFDEKKVLQAAVERVNLLQASPEVRAEHEARIRAERQNRDASKRLEYLEAQVAQTNLQAKRVAFESALARADVTPVVQAFDAKMGKQGSFARMVAQHANQVYLNSVQMAQMGRGQPIDLTPEQAIADFIRVYELSADESGAPAVQPKPTQQVARPQQKPVATPAPKPRVIPNISSKSASGTSAKPIFKSAQEIREFAKQRYGRG